MTTIRFFKKKEKFTGFQVKGHTGFEEEGKDILCAAISTATQMTVLAIKDELKLNPKIIVKDGHLEMILVDKDIDLKEVQLLMKTCYETLKQITKNKKKYVKMEVKENV